MTETIFEVSITLANDEMQTPGDVADALSRVAGRLRTQSGEWYDTEGPIRDVNGNTVGSWKVDAYTRDR